jgi:pyruvate formate lyase activating enzyme
VERFGLLKTTLIDFPGRVAATVFLGGCNLRCPYCHNRELALGMPPPGGVSLGEFELFLDRRRSTLGGVCITGGEALLSPLLTGIISLLRERKTAWKLDTNGTLPRPLSTILERFPDHPPEYAAVDIKTPFSRYRNLLGYGGTGEAEAEITASLGELSDRGIPWEARTTFSPRILELQELSDLALSVRGILDRRGISLPRRWVVQRFRPGDCLDPSWSEFAPPTAEETERAAAAVSAAGFEAHIR